MALEQWEIDLRKQLGNKINAKNTETWESQLKNEIKELVPSKKSNTSLMLMILIFLGVVTLCAYDIKTEGSVQNWIQSWFQSPDAPPVVDNPFATEPTTKDVRVKSNYETEIAALRTEIKRVEDGNKTAMDKMATKVQWNADRITLMAVMMNENFLIVRNNADKSHLIFFNRDWTLDQMPHYLQLADEDKEYLNKFVKPQ